MCWHDASPVDIVDVQSQTRPYTSQHVATINVNISYLIKKRHNFLNHISVELFRSE